MEVEGIIEEIFETNEFGAKGFKKREMVIITEEQYPQPILIEFVQDKCALLDHFKVGQKVSVGINLRGRKWVSPQGEVKYFNSVQGWRINTFGIPETALDNIPDKVENKVDSGDEPDDLPF